jgi:uncharacterized membrane protein
MIRKTLFSHTTGRGEFRLRGEDVKRIETFSDGVFAFAVTLLIVSLEVPKSYEELLVLMRGFLAFALCFAYLVKLWYDQHVFFRRYALDDKKTIVLNAALLFVILFFVYPLKFLGVLMFSDQVYGPGMGPFKITRDELPPLMVIYGVGYVVIYILFLLMYRHALSRRHFLELTALEVFDTRSRIYAYMIYIIIGLVAIGLALIVPRDWADLTGFFYFMVVPAFSVYFRRRHRMRQRIAET